MQSARSSNWKPATPVWKRETSGKEIRKPARAARLAQIRIRFLLLPGMKSKTNNPARGVNRTMLSKCWSIGLAHQVIPEQHQNAGHHEKRVRLNASGLQHAHRVGKHLHEERRESHRPVDNPGVPPHGDFGTESR